MVATFDIAPLDLIFSTSLGQMEQKRKKKHKDKL
jgi:hypothetical protein